MVIRSGIFGHANFTGIHTSQLVFGVYIYICRRDYRVFKFVSIVDAYDLSEHAI